MEGIIKHNPELQREAEVQSKTIFLANGTTATAISGDYAGAAGSNHGLVSYDELWGYTSESSIRLWEELTPVPTRRNSIRLVTTYAGFEGESALLWDLYSQHVPTEAIEPFRGPVYIGQTFEVPATVIAQSNGGAITVLAAFANEQMSLRRYVETIVKPFLVTNCPWVFNDRRLLFGVVEELETQSQCDFAGMLNSSLGGSWDPANYPWETRRDSMLDVFGKVQPYTMKPALQIDRSNARLLVEALSGRWSYEDERRDKRTLWSYVARAFSLCIDRIDPGKPPLGPPLTINTHFEVRRIQHGGNSWNPRQMIL